MYTEMKLRSFYIILLASLASQLCVAQDKKIAFPELQTAESVFFDSTAEKKEDPYKFSAPWRLEVGYTQFNHRTQDTSAIYLHGVRLGATVDFMLPLHFSIQTGAFATFTYGLNNQHWPSMDEENAQINILQNNILQLQLTVPVRAYYNITLWKKLRMFFFAGPQLQIGLTHYDIVKNNMSSATTQWAEQIGVPLTNHDKYITKELYRTNIQFGLGGGFEWDRYRLQAGYDFGLNNILRSNTSLNYKMNEWGWMCTFSYQL
jgi:hypothetical protein